MLESNRSKTLQCSSFSNCLRLTNLVGKGGGPLDSADFVAVQHVLQGTASLCCVSDSVTFADCCLVPQVFNAIRFRVNLSAFPVISAIVKHLETLLQFQAAHASARPDAVSISLS